VQYDASVMQPMVRNAGAAMGVNAAVHLIPGSAQYSSDVRYRALHAIEAQLAGTPHPRQAQAFGGLKAPR